MAFDCAWVWSLFCPYSSDPFKWVLSHSSGQPKGNPMKQWPDSPWLQGVSCLSGTQGLLQGCKGEEVWVRLTAQRECTQKASNTVTQWGEYRCCLGGGPGRALTQLQRKHIPRDSGFSLGEYMVIRYPKPQHGITVNIWNQSRCGGEHLKSQHSGGSSKTEIQGYLFPTQGIQGQSRSTWDFVSTTTKRTWGRCLNVVDYTNGLTIDEEMHDKANTVKCQLKKIDSLYVSVHGTRFLTFLCTWNVFNKMMRKSVPKTTIKKETKNPESTFITEQGMSWSGLEG